MSRQYGFITTIVNETPDGVINAHRLKHTNTALETCVVAFGAANCLVYSCAFIKPKQGCSITLSLNRFAARWAQPSHKSLGDNGAQC